MTDDTLTRLQALVEKYRRWGATTVLLGQRDDGDEGS